MKIKHSKLITEYIKLTIGVFLLALAVVMFFQKNELVTGGLTGLGIILENVTKGKIPIWLSYVILNSPLVIVGFIIKGRGFMIKTLYADVLLTGFMWMFQKFQINLVYELELINTAVFGGALAGIAIGLIIKAGGSTGGTDLIAAIIHMFVKQISISKLLFMLDSTIITVGMFLFGINKAMYAVIAVFVVSKIMDYIAEGRNLSKSVFIISDKSEEIAKVIAEKLDRGVTGFDGKGMYTGTYKNILLCVVNTKEIHILKEVLKDIDEKAFFIINDTKETFGKGFIN